MSTDLGLDNGICMVFTAIIHNQKTAVSPDFVHNGVPVVDDIPDICFFVVSRDNDVKTVI